MPRYIDADKLIEELQPAKDAKWNKNDHSKSMSEMIEDFCTELKNAPTADVVPKSKYDLAVAEREANVRGFTEAINTMKADVAREIFDEIRTKCVDDDGHFKYGEFMNLRLDTEKKYTEEVK